FTNTTPGLRGFDCMVERVRVRSVNNGRVTTPPIVTIGAPPRIGVPLFGVLNVPAAPGVGTPFDVGLSAGPFKTFILRGAIPPGGRYVISGSIDGQRFEEATLFTSDQQGARSLDFLCRFLRVERNAVGATPSVAFGCEGVLEPSAPGAGSVTLSIPEGGKFATNSLTDEEVLREYRVPLSVLQAPTLRLTLAGDASTPSEARRLTFNVRAGGLLGQPDGDILLT